MDMQAKNAAVYTKDSAVPAASAAASTVQANVSLKVFASQMKQNQSD